MTTPIAASGSSPALLHPDPLVYAAEPTPALAGAAVETMDSSGELTPSLKRALRLPSFESLGIANPHPDKPRLIDTPSPCACSISSGSRDAGSAICLQSANVTHAHNFLPLPQRLVSTLTPPSDTHELLWSRSAPSIDHATSFAVPAGVMPAGERPLAREDSVITPHLTPRTLDIVKDDDLLAPASATWLEAALDNLLVEHDLPTTVNRTYKVLSHALPCPSTEGHVFSQIMSALYEHPSTSATTWINVFHALPGRYSLNDLPKSPPATPGQPFHGEDYFTQKVFDTAFTISDYHTDLSLLPRSPRPAVPPGSVDIAIVERYIPPASTLEFATMFHTHAPSILVDRLVELSPDSGSLLFIYPTKSGAQTFANQYLAPILDPLLRTLAMVHDLPMAFCSVIGKLPVTSQLPDHEEAKGRLYDLCEQLSYTFQASRRSHYELVHASTALVHPPRHVWAADWWTKQEKDRVRGEITKWTQEGRNKRHSGPRTTSAEVLQQFLDGVAKRPYITGQEPKDGIEVNVFVVRRTERYV